MAWGDMANVPACQVVIMPECYPKTIPADDLELTHSTYKNSKVWQEK